MPSWLGILVSPCGRCRASGWDPPVKLRDAAMARRKRHEVAVSTKFERASVPLRLESRAARENWSTEVASHCCYLSFRLAEVALSRKMFADEGDYRSASLAPVRGAIRAVRRTNWPTTVRARRGRLGLPGEDGADRPADFRHAALARPGGRLVRPDRDLRRSGGPGVVDSARRPLPAARRDHDLRPLSAFLPDPGDRLDRLPLGRNGPRRPDRGGVLLARIPDPVAGQVRLSDGRAGDVHMDFVPDHVGSLRRRTRAMAGRADGGDRVQPALVPHAEPQGVHPGPRPHQPRPRRLGARHRTLELLVVGGWVLKRYTL